MISNAIKESRTRSLREKKHGIIETLPIQPLKPFNLEKSQYLKVGRENIERCPLQKLTVHSVREKSDDAAGNLNLLKR